MGHDISIISNHNLNVTSIQTSGKDISTRMKINVECYALQDYNIELEINGGYPSFERIELGNFIYFNTNETWQLEYRRYCIHEYFRQYGDKLFEHPYFKANQSRIDHFNAQRNGIWYDLNIETEDGEKWANIYPNLWLCEFHYFSRWSGLCEVFMKKNCPY